MRNNQRGSSLLLVIIALATLFAILGVSLERGIKVFDRIYRNHLENAALNLAEAGVEYSFHQLASTETSFQGKKEVMLDTGTFSIAVSHLDASEMVEILSTGTAIGKGRVDKVVKTLRILIHPLQEGAEQGYAIYSREEVR